MNASRPPSRVALVGCGAVASLYYAPALRALRSEGLLEVVALVDPDPARSQSLETHFPLARLHRDPAELSEDMVDLAIVASPPRFHGPQTIRLLQNGISVLCEKPMAATAAEAESMVEAATAARRVLAIGLVRRFLPACRTIRGILEQSILGDVQSFSVTEGGPFRWPTQSADYFDRHAAVGGVLADIGSHLLDLITWWMGEPSEVLYEDDAMGGVDVNCRLELKFPGGWDGVVRLSRDCELQSRCSIRGTKGRLLWSVDAPDELEVQFHGTASVLSGRLHEPRDPRTPSGPGRRVRNFEQSFIAQLRNVVASVRGGEQPFVTGRDALPGMRLMERCYRHRRLIPMGWLSERERGRAETLSGEARDC